MLRKIGFVSAAAYVSYYHVTLLYELKRWKTHSMEPIININNNVFIDKLKEPNNGEICVFV